MSRIAIGNLLVDLDLPSSYRCEYSVSGSLLARDEARGVSLEISGILVEPKDPQAGDVAVHHVLAGAREKGRAAERKGAVVLDHETRRGSATWFAGVGNQLVVATVTCRLPACPLEAVEDELTTALGSLAPAHDPLVRTGEQNAYCALRASHAHWFTQRRASLKTALDWAGTNPVPLPRLDDCWETLVSAPRTEAVLLDLRLNELSVALGDHLVDRGFEWCVVADPWGTSIGVVALQGTANVTIVPESFVGKRWERKEGRFFEAAVQSIERTLADARREHRP